MSHGPSLSPSPQTPSSSEAEQVSPSTPSTPAPASRLHHGRHNAKLADTPSGEGPETAAVPEPRAKTISPTRTPPTQSSGTAEVEQAGLRGTLVPVLKLALTVTAIISVMLIAFGLPGAKSGPHHVPVGVVAPTAAAQALTAQLNATDADAFDVTTYTDAATLRAAIQDREVYGGIVVAPDATQILTASAGSPTIATMMNALAAPLGQSTGLPVTVEDVVAPPATDPRGVGLAGAGLALTAAGMMPAIFTSRSFKNRPWVGLGAATLAAAGIGTAVSLLLHSPFDALEDAVLPVAAGLALGSIAISWPLLGLNRLLGPAGLYTGAAVMVLLGLSLSGLTSAPQLLPPGWGTLGQLLPPGADATLLRSTGYFDGAGAGHALTVLFSWAGLGLVLLIAGSVRHRRLTSNDNVEA